MSPSFFISFKIDHIILFLRDHIRPCGNLNISVWQYENKCITVTNKAEAMTLILDSIKEVALVSEQMAR